MAHHGSARLITRSRSRASICRDSHLDHHPRTHHVDNRHRHIPLDCRIHAPLRCSSLDHAIPYGIKSLCRDCPYIPSCSYPRNGDRIGGMDCFIKNLWIHMLHMFEMMNYEV